MSPCARQKHLEGSEGFWRHPKAFGAPGIHPHSQTGTLGHPNKGTASFNAAARPGGWDTLADLGIHPMATSPAAPFHHPTLHQAATGAICRAPDAAHRGFLPHFCSGYSPGGRHDPCKGLCPSLSSCSAFFPAALLQVQDLGSCCHLGIKTTRDVPGTLSPSSLCPPTRVGSWTRGRREKGFAPSWCLVSKNRANGKNPLEETSSGAEQDLNLCRKLSEQHLPRGAEGKFHCHSVKTKQTGKKIIAKYTSLGFEGGGPAMNLLVEFSEPYFSLWMHPKPLQLAGHPR